MARYLATGRIRQNGAIVKPGAVIELDDASAERLAHLGRIGPRAPEEGGSGPASPVTNPHAASTETADEPAGAGSDATAGASPDAPARSSKGGRP